MHSKAFFATILLSHAAKSLDSLENTLWALGGRRPGRQRTTKFGTCRIPYHEALIRASGKDLAQGQVALLDST